MKLYRDAGSGLLAALLVCCTAWPAGAVDAKGGAASAPKPGGVAIPMSRPTREGPLEALPPPRRFVSSHSLQVGSTKIDYRAIAGETYLYNHAGDPIGSIFSFSYLKDGPRDPDRPVMFVFNGGPGSSSVWLHMGVVGPKRVALNNEINPANVPPFGPVDNPYSPLDVADLVFIDPIGTGYSRVIGKGDPADFWGVDEDADSVAQFIELWLTEHGRWNSPKFIMGESYGSVRAAILPRALMGGPLYTGMMRGITVNGVILLGTVLQRPGTEPADAALTNALGIVAPADTAWYHQKIDRAGRTLESFHQEVTQFARDELAPALKAQKAATLTPDARKRLVTKLVAYTGLPASAFATDLTIDPNAYTRQLLGDRGLQVGAYDGRYTLTLAGSGNDPVADDPAMGQYVPGFVAAFHEMLTQDLGVRMERPYGAIAWKDVLPSWNWKRALAIDTDSYDRDLGTAMRRNQKLRVLVASGYYDLVTQTSIAESTATLAGWPMDRVTLRRYESGHMLYIGDSAGAFAADVRTLIRDATK